MIVIEYSRGSMKLDSYLQELAQIRPVSFEEYARIEKKRSSERLLQLCIECVIDVCKLLVAGLRMGLPSDETDLFVKIHTNGLISSDMAGKLREMRAFQNILVHEYGIVDDHTVYDALTARIADFQSFKTEILEALRRV